MDWVLIDTDVFSLFLRRDTRSALYDDDIRGRVRCLSFATVAELHFGAIAAGWGQSRCRHLEHAILLTQVLPVDSEIARRWAEVKAARQRLGRPIGSEDCWIAATALRHRIPLLTHNARDYQDIPGLTVVTHPESTV
jgi:tRNA(fMet)-specific endonuclease VapC